MAPSDLFLSEQHPVSRRWAIVEDDGVTAWLYLTHPNSQTPAADCWLYNRVDAPRGFDSSRGRAPLVPATYARDPKAVAPPNADSVIMQWSFDGESVAVAFHGRVVGFIAAGHRRGFSENLSKEGPFGSPIDRQIYERVFGER